MYKIYQELFKEDSTMLASLASRTNDAQDPSKLKNDITQNIIKNDDLDCTDEITRSFQIGKDSPIKRVIFLTVAFPNHEYVMRYKECTTRGPVIRQGLIKYFKCMPSEQYEFVINILKKHFEVMFFESLLHYDIFFEVTKNGNIHFHGRISFNKKLQDKEVKLSFHRMFKTPTKFIRTHVDVKDYDHKLWNDYDNKKEKGYQTTDHPHFTNIIKK